MSLVRALVRVVVVVVVVVVVAAVAAVAVATTPCQVGASASLAYPPEGYALSTLGGNHGNFTLAVNRRARVAVQTYAARDFLGRAYTLLSACDDTHAPNGAAHGFAVVLREQLVDGYNPTPSTPPHCTLVYVAPPWTTCRDGPSFSSCAALYDGVSPYVFPASLGGDGLDTCDYEQPFVAAQCTPTTATLVANHSFSSCGGSLVEFEVQRASGLPLRYEREHSSQDDYGYCSTSGAHAAFTPQSSLPPTVADIDATLRSACGASVGTGIASLTPPPLAAVGRRLGFVSGCAYGGACTTSLSVTSIDTVNPASSLRSHAVRNISLGGGVQPDQGFFFDGKSIDVVSSSSSSSSIEIDLLGQLSDYPENTEKHWFASGRMHFDIGTSSSSSPSSSPSQPPVDVRPWCALSFATLASVKRAPDGTLYGLSVYALEQITVHRLPDSDDGDDRRQHRRPRIVIHDDDDDDVRQSTAPSMPTPTPSPTLPVERGLPTTPCESVATWTEHNSGNVGGALWFPDASTAVYFSDSDARVFSIEPSSGAWTLLSTYTPDLNVSNVDLPRLRMTTYSRCSRLLYAIIGGLSAEMPPTLVAFEPHTGKRAFDAMPLREGQDDLSCVVGSPYDDGDDSNRNNNSSRNNNSNHNNSSSSSRSSSRSSNNNSDDACGDVERELLYCVGGPSSSSMVLIDARRNTQWLGAAPPGIAGQLFAFDDAAQA